MTPVNRSFLFTMCLILMPVMGLSGCQESYQDVLQPSSAPGLLIKNATIVDGTGAAAFQGDIRVVGERIANISDDLEAAEGEQLIDATGLVVAPGFIDMHAHVSNIHEYPQAENFLRQGVTTIANSLHSSDQPWPLDEYTANLKMAPNIAYFAGFNWTRQRVMGLDNRPPTNAELQQMKALVSESMQHGAFGLSSGMEYVPAVYASNEEVTELAKVAADWGGIYITHMRDEGPNLLQSIRDNAEIGDQANLPVHINHIKTTGVSNHGKSIDALALVDSVRASGVDMTLDIYPYAAFMTYSDLLFPAWSLSGGPEEFRARINDPVLRNKIAEEMKAIFPQQAGKDFDSIQFEGLPRIQGYGGLTLGDYLNDHDIPATMDAAVEALIDLQAQGRFAAIYHSMDELDIERFLQYPYTMINSDGDLAVAREKHYHPRTYGSFPRVLSTYVRARGVLSLSQAIHKMTGQSAERLGLSERGTIRIGNFADLVIFDDRSITDNATFLEPHQYSTGVKHLMINGELVLDNEKLTNVLPGQVLRHEPQIESALELRENARAEALFESIYHARLARSPINEGFEGIRDQQDKWDNFSDAYQLESNELDKAHRKNLQKLIPALLSDANQLNLRLYEQELDSALEEFKWRYHRYPISHMTGIHTGVVTVLIRLHRIEGVEDARDYISRLQGVRELFDQLICGLQTRAEMGIIAPTFVYQQAVESLQQIIVGRPFENAGSADNPLMADFSRKLEKLDIRKEQKKQLQSEAEQALLESVGPAYQKLIAVLNDLQRQSEVEGGAWTLPQGQAFYRHALHQTTTTKMDADSIHRLGLSEVERIHGEMKVLIKQAGYQGDLPEFFAHIQAEPTLFYPQTEEGKRAYIEEAMRVISEIKVRLPEVFNVVPIAEIMVKPVEPFREKASVGIAFYQPGAADGSRPGVFYANTYDMSAMPKYSLPTFAYHEGIPGHHMQVSIAQELDNVPQFRRAASYVSYAEGWGLYAELLPKEMGLYVDFYTDFGRLSAELLRACRLVVDTGLHDKRWSREKAINYLMANSSMERVKATKAVERYLVLPSQATAYKIGMLKILELRRKAKHQLGNQFDIREFHDVVLSNGALPLNFLEEMVDRWIVQRLVATEQ
ncbi:MAG: DUF885 family protein [Gammaproteobacteria bacterium]|jgi:uncharacterized protein (DUF885 family)|nr:DUF885 family protein [Gammaproteobacteria bacterium]MBT3867825.1 DUF885 family protein [Gammaproteobacteria bacterium]MBT4378327.1 DUF885 family protein [Gammaproteobacteria bacterium]MBT5197607.1 DUF885 family protein [Gammaproteobacteria bacterium]MBT5443564.1 DUF885 family protein [Gammaproteobacteria bacterium]